MRGIPFNVDEKSSRYLMKLVRDQPGDTSPYILLKKVWSVLRWKYPKEEKKPREIMEDFSESLARNGTELTIEQEREAK